MFVYITFQAGYLLCVMLLQKKKKKEEIYNYCIVLYRLIIVVVIVVFILCRVFVVCVDLCAVFRLILTYLCTELSPS
jgi:hypothetical protein